MTREAVIVGSVRTGLTKAHRGSFNMTEPVNYTAHVLREVVAQQPNLDPAEIEDVIIGCGNPEGCMGLNMARVASMVADIPKTAAATTVNRFCSSGSQAVMMAANEIILDGADVAIGGGVETITMMQDGTANTTRLVNATAAERFPGLYFPMGVTAEVVADRYKISREDQDVYAVQSQQRYAAADDAGYVAEEIAPMKVTRKVTPKEGDAYEEDFTVEKDECNRPGTTLEGLQKLKPVFKKDGSVTAGNASQLSDGGERAWDRADGDLSRFGRGRLWSGRDGNRSGLCRAEALEATWSHDERHRHCRTQRGLRITAPLLPTRARYSEREAEPLWRIDFDRASLWDDGIPDDGSAPFGMTGSRMTGLLVRQLKRTGGRYGIVTMCIGGGQGFASLFEAC